MTTTERARIQPLQAGYRLLDGRYDYRKLAATAERIANMTRDRARLCCKQAGLDPSLLGIHPHNAMCSYRDGKPWTGVNYSLVRKTLWLLEKQWEASHALDRLYKRLGYAAFYWGY